MMKKPDTSKTNPNKKSSINVGSNPAKSVVNGDCFYVHTSYILEEATDDTYLVQAVVSGQGRLKGYRYVHSWLEINDEVIDMSNGKHLILSKELYYALGDVKEVPGQYVRYSRREALNKALDTMHYGPWEIDHEDPVQEVMNDICKSK